MTPRLNYMTTGFNSTGRETRASVIAIGVRALVDFAVTRGADRQALFDRSGIDSSDLVDPHGRVAFASFKSLMRAAKELCNDPAFALHFGEMVDLSEVSIANALGGI